MQSQNELEQELLALGTELREIPSVAPAVMRSVGSQAPVDRSPIRSSRHAHTIFAKPAAIAAAAAIVLAVSMMVSVPMRVAFGQVINNVRDADSVSFLLTEGPADSGKHHKCLAEGRQCRVERSSGIVIVCDLDSRQQLFIDPASKSAGVFELREGALAELGPGIVEQFRKLNSADAERIGEEKIDGKVTEVFRVRGKGLFGLDSTDSDKLETKIWIDRETMLPWRIQLRAGDRPFVTLHQLCWNVPIDPELLLVVIPDGYSERDKKFFDELLRPERAQKTTLTPTEAFRKWISGAD